MLRSPIADISNLMWTHPSSKEVSPSVPRLSQMASRYSENNVMIGNKSVHHSDAYNETIRLVGPQVSLGSMVEWKKGGVMKRSIQEDERSIN